MAAKYKDALKSISARTGAPLPSLIISFGLLHELTAIIPLVGGFYAARAFGVGETVVRAVKEDNNPGWMHQKAKTWLDEGANWTDRVGRRYGYFGLEKGSKASDSAVTQEHHLAGDIANAVVAYGLVKLLVPARIGVSLYLSPAFSRRIVDPTYRFVAKRFRRPPQ
ncbi:hypothetical protein CYLTODRAFT_349404 [Cylindrobasidium torrendii FP15055 ss-10]|uniref:Uncharacterized protein n=1 Tax=Cylindrobasidium torrendii FP15055 ss-10 TaxID=1314674 RepID=A0A0D7BH74_9AGAR|nr:hypothetical protein CYLTODRAFT_349404 [Cylindrobasidium torrendii FP15055 ss-10]